MRFLATVVSAAILIAVVALFVIFIADGYFGTSIFPGEALPDAWTAPDSWSEWRDIVIVGGGFFFALSMLLLAVLLFVLVLLVFTVRRLLRENVAPAVDSLKATLDNVQGTTEFVGETAVAPIVRVYSVVKGIRGGMGAVAGLPGRIRGRKKKG
jgi:hypothetical protein